LKSTDRQKQKESGLILVLNSEPDEGIVVDVGPGKLQKDGTRLEMPVKKGDHVFYGSRAGQKFIIDDEEFIAINADDILGIYEHVNS